MEKAGHRAADKFIDALIKSVQSLCHGYLEFQNGIEIIGFINLSVDKGNSLDCVLKEKVCKTAENATSFISNSYHANQHSEDTSTDSDQSGNLSHASKRTQEGSVPISDAINSDCSQSRHSDLKRIRSEEQNSGDVPSKKSVSHPNSISHSSSENVYQTSLPHSTNPKADYKKRRTSGVGHTSVTEPLPSPGAHSPEDPEPMKLTGIVLEPVEDRHYTGDDGSEGDFDVTFIKEEYIEEEFERAEFNPDSQQLPANPHYGRGQTVQPSSYCPTSVTSATVSSSAQPTDSVKPEPIDHPDNPGIASYQPHPGPSSVRGYPSRQFDLDHSSLGDLIASCVDTQQAYSNTVPKLTGPTHPHTSMGTKREDADQMLHSNMTGGAAYDKDVTQSKILLCEYCDASFTSSGGLSLHKATVHLQRRFVCRICGKVLKRKATLINHMYSHKSDALA